MNIEPFAVEEWMNEHEVGARFNIAETCVDSVSLDELLYGKAVDDAGCSEDSDAGAEASDEAEEDED